MGKFMDKNCTTKIGRTFLLKLTKDEHIKLLIKGSFRYCVNRLAISHIIC